MKYLKMRKYIKLFKDFKKLTFAYWKSLPEQIENTLEMESFRYIENEESLNIRENIVKSLPHVEDAANDLKILYIYKSIPAPDIGGVIIPFSIFRSTINPEMGHEVLDRTIIIDTINESISIAEKRSREELIHILLPWNWVIELAAFIIRIPFIILRRAGLPPKVEENIIAHAIKIIGTIIVTSWLAYKGILLTNIDIIDLIKNLFK